MLSTSVFVAFPSVHLDGPTWPYRYNALWPLPGRIATPGAAARGEERRFVAERLGELPETPPRLLAIDRRPVPPAFSSWVDLEIYFSSGPDLRCFLQRRRFLDSIDRAAVSLRGPAADRQGGAAESPQTDLSHRVGDEAAANRGMVPGG